ncbi:MAG TPA: NlpC/P60 family protein, partial [Candidatus Elarobacter sp.]|nr:NlpC/P60 family protein [Candidatus Elarobacter sp.]
MTLARPLAVASPKPFARFSASARSVRDSIVALTRSQLGVKYRRGAASPDRGFDCSGLVKYVMEHFGANVPR